MTPIQRIERLDHPGSLRDFVWPSDLQEFGRFNLIYGWNATGKTTISRVFRALEMRAAPEEGDATLLISGTAVRGADFGTATLPVRVFNRDFVSGNVMTTTGHDVPPILVLGARSVERQRDLEHLKQRLADAERLSEEHASKHKHAVITLDQYCIDQARTIKTTLRSPGQGPYNNYDKSDFRSRAEAMLTAGSFAAHRLNDVERGRLLSQHSAQPKPLIDEVTWEFPSLAESQDQVKELLRTTVVSAVIQPLKDNQPVSDWVREGLRLHNQDSAGRCLFCDQPLPPPRMRDLEAHFSDAYEQFLGRLDTLIEVLRAESERTAGVQLPDPARLYDSLLAEYNTRQSQCDELLRSAQGFLDALVQTLHQKRARVFESYTIQRKLPPGRAEAITDLNCTIQEHNSISASFSDQVAAAKERLEADSVANSLSRFEQLLRDVTNAAEAAQAASAEVKRLQAAIAKGERAVMEHRRPAEELNQDLQHYLGHGELQLSIRDTGYQITRNGDLAEDLSEGETTAIALLYFLKSLRDDRFDLSNGVVVIDDPVSSLDANALYLAFGYIKERTQNAAQLFILTHNFTLFRQVKNWFHHVKGQGKKDATKRPARFYMLDWLLDREQRTSTLRPLDPLLEEYESDYHYLFARIYREVQRSAQAGLEESYVLPNMARRLLETFLGFHRPQVPGQLWDKMQATDWNEAKKIRILRFVNTHSHADFAQGPEYDSSPYAEARAVLRDVLELIRSQSPDHYEAMEAVVTQHAGENGDE